MQLQISLGSLQCLPNRDIHIKVAIGTETPNEAYRTFLFGSFYILAQQCLFVRQPNWVIRDIAWFTKAAELFGDHSSSMFLPRREMLVLCDSGEGHLLVWIAHNSTALKVAIVAAVFEVEGSVAKTAELEIEEAIKLP